MIDSISEPLAYRLRGLDDDSKLQVIVVSANLEGFGKVNSYFIDNEVEKQDDSYGRVSSYFMDGIETQGDLPIPFSSSVDMTKRQIYSLAEQPHVRAIIENQRVHSP